MFTKAIQYIVDSVKWHCSSAEFKTEQKEMVNRLQVLDKSAAAKSYRDLDSNNASKSTRAASLFESVPRTRSVERRSIGHWCELSAAAARESRLAKIERAYETDFRSPTNNDLLQLDEYIAKHAKNTALVSYVKRTQPALRLHPNAVDTTSGITTNHNRGEASHELYTGSDSLLYKMAQFEDPAMRASVASNENTPLPILWLLLDDEFSEVRMALLDNDKLPFNILEKLQTDVSELVVRKAQSRLRKVSKEETGIVFGMLNESTATSEARTLKLQDDSLAS